MPINLHDLATTRHANLRDAAEVVGARLDAVRTDVRRRFEPDPATPGEELADVPDADLAERLGAREHLREASERLVAAGQREAAARDALAAVDGPGSSTLHENELRDALIEAAGLRVYLRHAEERLAAAETESALLDQLLAAAAPVVEQAEQRKHDLEKQFARSDDLRSRMTALPADAASDQATTALGDTEITDAADRLAALLPEELHDRIFDRLDEVAAARAAAATSADGIAAVLASRAETLRPFAEPVDRAAADLDRAEAAVERYLAGGLDTVAWANAAFDAVAATPDLNAEQMAALDAAARTDAIAAIALEADVVAKVNAIRAAEATFESAELAELALDPDADPADVTAATDATAAADAALRAGSLDTDWAGSMVAYDAVRRDLDEWEVEVPAVLWDAVAQFSAAKRALEVLVAPSGASLVTALDDAEAALNAALDAEAERTLTDWQIGRRHAERSGRLAAMAGPIDARRRQHAAGDGPGGRTDRELARVVDIS